MLAPFFLIRVTGAIQMKFRSDYDSPWKEIIEFHFRDFIAFFFPVMHREIDWSKPVAFMNRELRRIAPSPGPGGQIADHLVKVWRKGVGETWVLIHIEIQSWRDPDFARRMFTYYYRLFDRHRHGIASVAILGDDSPGWRPDRFSMELWGCDVRLRFPAVKLSDYRGRRSELEKSGNVFSLAVMAHLSAMETKGNPALRKTRKMELIRLLLRRGHSKEQIFRLFRFIDWMIQLPEELELDLQDEIQEELGKADMTYYTFFERRLMKELIQKGESNATQRSASVLRNRIAGRLRSRFGHIPEDIPQSLNRLNDPGVLLDLYDLAIDAPSLEEIASEFAKIGRNAPDG